MLSGKSVVYCCLVIISNESFISCFCWISEEILCSRFSNFSFKSSIIDLFYNINYVKATFLTLLYIFIKTKKINHF